MDLQELIQRGRFIMAGASERLKVFNLVNGKRTAKDIADNIHRDVHNVQRDLSLMFDAGLIEHVSKEGKSVTKNGFVLFDKLPLARTVPLRYFSGPTAAPISAQPSAKPSSKTVLIRRLNPLCIPSEQLILDIAKSGESQIYEFKGKGTETRKITREIAAMLNTRQGGQIFYGIDDDGNIEGSDLILQKFDQSIQNSVRNSISPPATIRLHRVMVISSPIIIITVTPWDRQHVYMFDEKVLIRKGTNVFAAKPDELKDLHIGKPVI